MQIRDNSRLAAAIQKRLAGTGVACINDIIDALVLDEVDALRTIDTMDGVDWFKRGRRVYVKTAGANLPRRGCATCGCARKPAKHPHLPGLTYCVNCRTVMFPLEAK